MGLTGFSTVDMGSRVLGLEGLWMFVKFMAVGFGGLEFGISP